MSENGNGSILSLQGSPWWVRSLMVAAMTVGIPTVFMFLYLGRDFGWFGHSEHGEIIELIRQGQIVDNYYDQTQCQFIAKMAGEDPRDCIIPPFAAEARKDVSRAFNLPASKSASASSSVNAYGFNPITWEPCEGTPGRPCLR